MTDKEREQQGGQDECIQSKTFVRPAPGLHVYLYALTRIEQICDNILMRCEPGFYR